MLEDSEILDFYSLGRKIKVDLSKIVNQSVVARMRNFPGYLWVVIEPEVVGDENEIWLVPLNTRTETPMVPNVKNLIKIDQPTAIYLYRNDVFVPLDFDETR
jgi:hypothetical protein